MGMYAQWTVQCDYPGCEEELTEIDGDEEDAAARAEHYGWAFRPGIGWCCEECQGKPDPGPGKWCVITKKGDTITGGARNPDGVWYGCTFRERLTLDGGFGGPLEGGRLSRGVGPSPLTAVNYPADRPRVEGVAAAAVGKGSRGAVFRRMACLPSCPLAGGAETSAPSIRH